MAHPVFLSLSDLTDIHADQIERYGGRPGVLDVGLLRSALAMPQAGVSGQYLHHDLFEMAAAYLYHIVQDHPFVDGNKRTGVVAAIVFLELNGRELLCREDDLEALVLATARGERDKTEIAAFFREHCH